MHLSLLSEGYVSDSYNDAGLSIASHPRPSPCPVHFIALCRGLVVLFVLALPIGMTLFARPTRSAVQQDEAASNGPHIASPHAKDG